MDPQTLALIASMFAGSLQGLAPHGSAGSTGYDVVNFNDPYDATSRAMSSAYMQDVINALRAGQVPDWMNRFTEPLQADLQRQNRDTFFGKEGMAGGSVMDMAQSAGAMQGVGGRAAIAPVNKALSDYADRMSGINQYIAGIKNQYMQNASATVPSQLYDMGRRDNHIVQMSQPGAAANPLWGAAAGALGGINWKDLFTSMQTNGTPNAQQTVVPQTSYGFGTPSSNQALQGLFPLTGQYTR